MKKQFRDFEEAREFIRSLGLKSNAEWRTYWKSHSKPDYIPAAPERTYKNEWKGWGDFLGTHNIHEKKWRSFEDARKFAHTLELNTLNEWTKFTQSNRRPDDIPVHPERTYKNEWKGSGDWLGTGTVASKDRVYRPFKEAREFAQSLNFKSRKDWEKYSKSGQKPEDIPFLPRRNYKNEWKGWGDWLGTGNIADKDRVYRPFNEAREFVRTLNLKGQREWNDYCKSGNKPDDIPSNPWNTYKEWKKK